MPERPADFEDLVARYGDELFGLACWMLGNVADAEDVVQETFLGAFRGLESFERRASERTWLAAILVRQVARRRRDLAKGRSLRLAHEARWVEPAAGASDARADLRVMLEKLTPEQRDVIVLRELRGFSYDEMATVLGIPLGTVESRLHRARAMLKEQLTNSAGDSPKPVGREEGRTYGAM